VTRIFGEVADVYDAARPGYPEQIASAILDYHTFRNATGPARVVEIGAGTGKGTAVLMALGVPLTCVEPDPQMAAVLRRRLPAIHVEVKAFEEWTADAPVPLIACAMAWHWLDPATRNKRMYAALAPGGTLAVFGHRYDYADPVQRAAIDAEFRAVDPAPARREDGWFARDVADSGLFVDVETRLVSREVPLSTQDYLDLVRTFSPFRRHSAATRAALLAALATVVGDEVVLDLRTSLALATKEA
jgi:SAM-dependent methyltransferase